MILKSLLRPNLTPSDDDGREILGKENKRMLRQLQVSLQCLASWRLVKLFRPHKRILFCESEKRFFISKLISLTRSQLFLNKMFGNKEVHYLDHENAHVQSYHRRELHTHTHGKSL